MRRFAISGELALALGVIGFGVVLIVQTMGIEVSPGYARVGPRVFPWIISGALIVLGLWLARDAIVGQWVAEDSAPSAPEFDWQAFLLIGFGLIVHMILIDRLGFIIASTVLFVCVTTAFGNRHWLRSLAIGVVLSTVVYIGFDYGLDLGLPAGVLEGIL